MVDQRSIHVSSSLESYIRHKALFSLQGKHPCSGGFYRTSPTNLSLLCLLWRLIVEAGGRRFFLSIRFQIRKTDWCSFSSNGALVLHDPCALVFFWPKTQRCSTFVMAHCFAPFIFMHQYRCFSLLWVQYLLVLYLVKMHSCSL